MIDLDQLEVHYQTKDGAREVLSPHRLTLIDATTGQPFKLATEAVVVLHLTATAKPRVIGLEALKLDEHGKLVRGEGRQAVRERTGLLPEAKV